MSTQHHNEYFYGYILLGDIVLSSLRQTWLDREGTNVLKNKNWNEKHPRVFGWLQLVDSATQGRLWYACKYYVNTHNKNLRHSL